MRLRRRRGPLEDTPAAPGGPAELGVRRWGKVLRRSVSEFRDDNLTDWAAALTYYGVMALLLGAELNAELERGRELAAGLPAERDIQLPPRAAPSS